MSYIKNGQKTYTLKEKKQYHESLANTGVNNNTGEKLTTSQRIRHGILAVECARKQNRFQRTGSRIREMHVAKYGNNKNDNSF